tara:strand:- start:258 stop:563 length:306 start_codon:yes stop_codon:yes gene_type:complete
MSFIKFHDAAAEAALAGNGDQIILADNVLNVSASANACTIGYLLLGASEGQVDCTINSTGNGTKIKAKVLDALRLVDGGGNVVMDMSDTATTSITGYNGFA